MRALANPVFLLLSSPYHRWKSRTPVSWARFGMFSFYVAKIVKTLAPPLLIISLPRSGSSWVGEILGGAQNALYLREPINQSVLAAEGRTSIVEIDPYSVGGIYKKAAEYAFSGFPVFSDDIMLNPGQWKLGQRKNRRLVVKEVNPLACKWLLQYKPRVVFLLRHPAAVALSFQRLRWWDSNQPGGWQETGCWRKHGEYQASILRKAYNSLRNYRDLHVVHYEHLCEKPLEMFSELFDFAGLEWDNNIEQLITKHSSNTDDSDPYSTTRYSLAMTQAWRAKVRSSDLEELRKGYEFFDVPWYRAEKDW